MARRKIRSVESDFQAVISFLKGRGIVPESAPQTLIECARKIHRSTYSLILWRFRLNRLPNHSKVFIDEIASDALQVLPQVMQGYGKTTNLLIRGIIENTLRHLYFADHPIEFGRMNQSGKWFLTMDNLFEYPKIHPDLVRGEKAFDSLDQLSSLYSDLSAGVHGRTVRDLEMRTALEKIQYTAAEAKKHTQWIEKCAGNVNFTLAIFHRHRMLGFQEEDRRVILRTMPKRARSAWTEFE